jgi:hypothetical protein
MNHDTVIDEKLYGTDLFGESMRPTASGVVAKRFGAVPFTVLDTRQGEWQARKRAWTRTGIDSKLGRDAVAYSVDSSMYRYWPLDTHASIFDPVLCELSYSWFTRHGASIVDPFAGGSVRGIVAGAMGRRYWGSDLSARQIEANRLQAMDLGVDAEWVHGDSLETLADAPAADFLFSCPPYGDLEVYSDDPADLSTMEYHTFVANYKRIIRRACKVLRPDRFACFVVANYRDKKGHLRDFVGDTVRAFTEQGLHYYNEAVLVTAVGSAAMRVTKQFEASRKLCKTHQNVLVFVKGYAKKASRWASGER